MWLFDLLKSDHVCLGEKGCWIEVEVFIHLPDAEQSPHTPEKNNCILTETKQPSLELGPRETLSPSVWGLLYREQQQAWGRRVEELCLLLSGEVPEPGPLQVSSGQHRPLLLPQTSPPTSPALANRCTLVMAPLANRHLRSMRQVGLQDLLASFLTKPPKSHLVAGKAERWSLFCYVKTRLYGLFLKMSQ